MATAGYLDLTEGDAPGTPGSGISRVYPDSSGRPLAKNDAGTVFALYGAMVDTTNVSNPPTDAELDSAFGTPAANAGKLWILNDNNADTNNYLVTSNGTSWLYVALTKAT